MALLDLLTNSASNETSIFENEPQLPPDPPEPDINGNGTPRDEHESDTDTAADSNISPTSYAQAAQSTESSNSQHISINYPELDEHHISEIRAIMANPDLRSTEQAKHRLFQLMSDVDHIIDTQERHLAYIMVPFKVKVTPTIVASAQAVRQPCSIVQNALTSPSYYALEHLYRGAYWKLNMIFTNQEERDAIIGQTFLF